MCRPTDDRGETLIEILITVVVIAIGFVAVASMMGSSIVASDVHRSQAEAEVITRAFAEAIQAKAMEPVGPEDHVPCPTALELTPDYVPPRPEVWEVAITGVEWWIRDRREFSSVLEDCTAVCPAAGCEPGLDSGLQLVTITVSSTREGAARADLTSTVIVRRGNPEEVS